MTIAQPPLWNILIATLGQRGDRLQRLMSVLGPQLEPYKGAVVVTAYWNNGERPLSHIRQALVDGVEAEYLSCIDDDDMVPENFVSTVVPLLDGVDYVGWKMQAYVDGAPLKPTFHTLEHDHWWDDANGYYRDVSHLNPVATILAKQADFRKGEPPEDVSWASQLRPYLLTEAYIPEVMYHYYSSSTDTTWRPGSVSPGNYARPIIDSPYFSYHAESTT